MLAVVPLQQTLAQMDAHSNPFRNKWKLPVFTVLFTQHVFIGCCLCFTPALGAETLVPAPRSCWVPRGPCPIWAGNVREVFLCFR